jgi:hypothetical protein
MTNVARLREDAPSTAVAIRGDEHYRQSTDAASICKAIVVETAKKIGDRNYVCVEGWQAIAVAHGCAASARDVEHVPGGVRAIGEVRRMSDGAVIAQGEGFVGEDEPTWYGGVTQKWKWSEKRGEKVWYDATLPKRADYAIRAMAQTRAISRACRSAFAHVVVMMNAGLSTTPAEEVPAGGFDDEPAAAPRSAPQTTSQPASGTMRDVTPPKTAEAAQGAPGGPPAHKRLTPTEAMQRGLHDEIKNAIFGCTTLAEVAEWDAAFDRRTAECPEAWLKLIRADVDIHAKELMAKAAGVKVDPLTEISEEEIPY